MYWFCFFFHPLFFCHGKEVTLTATDSSCYRINYFLDHPSAIYTVYDLYLVHQSGSKRMYVFFSPTFCYGKEVLDLDEHPKYLLIKRACRDRDLFRIYA